MWNSRSSLTGGCSPAAWSWEASSYPSSSVCPSANGSGSINCIVGKPAQGMVRMSSLEGQKTSSERSAGELLVHLLQWTFQKGTISQAPCRKVAGTVWPPGRSQMNEFQHRGAGWETEQRNRSPFSWAQGENTCVRVCGHDGGPWEVHAESVGSSSVATSSSFCK